MLNRPNILIENENFKISYHADNKSVILIRKNDEIECIAANFFQDTADGATLVGNFKYLVAPTSEDKFAKILVDMLSQYLANSNQPVSKLFCTPEKCESEFLNSEDYRSSNIDRLMIRESKKNHSIESLPMIKASQLDENLATQEDIRQITSLLKQTYWAEDAEENYTRNALKSSTFFIARSTDNKIIGLIRYISNNDIAYISDMVVDKDWRKMNIATLLMNILCEHSDKSNRFTLLISAKEGDGKDAAPKLYGNKFGFNDYDTSHSNNVFFRYIRATPKNVLNNSISSAAKSGILLISNANDLPTVDGAVSETTLKNKK